MNLSSDTMMTDAGGAGPDGGGPGLAGRVDAGATDLSPDALLRGDGVSAWRRIADALEHEIAAGALAPGAQLPVEAQLARRFAVNRHTVRRALAELARRGLVRAAQGRGTFVEARPLAYAIGPRTRFSEIVGRAGREPEGELLDAMTLAASARVAADLRVDDGAPVLRLTTLRRADGVPIAVGHGWFPLPRFAGLDEAYRRAGALTPALAELGVAEYRRAVTRVSARAATAEEALRLDLAPTRPVLTVDSVNVDAAGTPIQATQGVFPADRCELVFES